jgi:putative endonuclease
MRVEPRVNVTLSAAKGLNCYHRFYISYLSGNCHSERSEESQQQSRFPMNQYYVYIMTNKSRTLYTGVTNNLERRVSEHKQKLIPGFTSKYNIDKLVYYEVANDISSAISREKEIKGWVRIKKIAIIESRNPGWCDLSLEWS